MKITFSPPTMYGYTCMLISMIMLTTGLAAFHYEQQVMYTWPLMFNPSFSVMVSLISDPFSYMFSSVVLFIAGNVLIFAKTYMSGDPHILRFTHLVLMFVLSMLVLVFMPNLVTLMVGWDGLGIVSFLLVVYYSNPKSLGAGMLTALTNRLGDALIILSLVILLPQHHCLPFMWPMSSWMAPLMVLAAFTKSAQMPFSSWLPAAMAAPTPVSALVHSSTLVTAGVYLLFRMSPSLEYSNTAINMCLIMGGATMMMSGLVAMMETDMKKIIALSTLSQLGLMVFTFGLKLPLLAFFHMCTHALFKALMFICMGHMIALNSHNQDMRTAKTSGTNITSSCFTIANLALIGTPFMAAFYSKDAILEMTPFTTLNLVTYALAILSTGLTAAYSSRLLMWTLTHPPSVLSSTEDNSYSPYPMINLSVAALMGGALMNWMMIQPLSISPLCQLSKMWPLLITLMGMILGAAKPTVKPPTMSLLTNMLLLVPLSTKLPLKMVSPSVNAITTLDQGWNEILGGVGLGKTKKMLVKPLSGIEPKTSLLQLTMSLLIAACFML